MQTAIGSGLDTLDAPGQAGDKRADSRRGFGAVAMRSLGHNDLPAAG